MKGFLSFIVTNLAILVLSLAFLAWVVDATILEPKKLLPALEKNDTSAAIAGAIPAMVQTEGPAEQSLELTNRIKQLATKEYVQEKLTALVTGFTSYIKTGQPEPGLDLSDFPAKLAATGMPVPPELYQQLSKPITFKDKNAQTSFDALRQNYKLLQLVKYAGLVIGVLLLVADWFLADRGRKALRIGNIFVALAFWGAMYWYALGKIPGFIVGRFDASPQGAALEKIAVSILSGVSGLLTQYFKTFALVCAGIGAACYLTHFILKRLHKAPPPPPAPARPLPNKR